MNIKGLKILDSNDRKTVVYYRATDVLNIYFFFYSPVTGLKFFTILF